MRKAPDRVLEPSRALPGHASPAPPDTSANHSPTGGNHRSRRRPSLTLAEIAELARRCPDDRIIAGELARRSAPRPEPKPAPVGTSSNPASSESPAHVPMLARLLTLDFDDERSYSGLLAIVQRAWRGEITTAALLDCYRQAMGPNARRRGAVFTYAVARAGVAESARGPCQ